MNKDTIIETQKTIEQKDTISREEQFWTTKDWYNYIFQNAKQYLQREETNARNVKYDALVQEIINECTLDLSSQAKDNLFIYVQQKQKIQLLKMLLYILSCITATVIALIYLSDFRKIILIFAMIVIGVILLDYVKIGKPIRDALMRACAK